MNNETVSEFRRKIEYGYFINAYEILIHAFEEYPGDPDLLTLSRELHDQVYAKAYELGTNKATEFSSEANTTDVLVRLTGLLIKKLGIINR
jgi:hypothetical protein